MSLPPNVFREDPSQFDGTGLDRRDPAYIRELLPVMELFYRYYFRASASGLENLPRTGPALVVGNHVHPAAAGIIEERPVGQGQRLRAGADLQAQVQGLAPANGVGQTPLERQVHLELASADLGVDLGDPQRA